MKGFVGEFNRTTAVTTKRRRRQVIIGLLAAFGLVNAGLSMYNTYELTTLQTDVKASLQLGRENEEKISFLAENQRILSKRMEGIQDNVKTLYAVAHNLTIIEGEIVEEFDLQTAVTTAFKAYSLMNAKIQQFTVEVSHLLQKRITPQMLPISHITAEMDLLKETLEKKNLKFFSSSPTMWYTYRVQTVRTDSTYLMIEVPINSYAEPLQLFRYQPLPVKIGNVSVLIKPKDDFLIVDSLSTYYATAKEDQLARCQVFDTIYHCGEQPIAIYRKDFENDCLAALYTNQVQRIEHVCDIMVDETKEVISIIDSTTLRIMVQEPIAAKVTCNEKLQDPLLLTGNHLVTTNHSCKIVTPKHVIHTGLKLNVKADLIRIEVNFTTMLGRVDFSQTKERISEILNKTRYVPSDPVPLLTFRQASHNSQPWYQPIRHWGVNTILIITLVVILILMVCCCKKICQRHRYHRGNDEDDDPPMRIVKNNFIRYVKPSAPVTT